MRLVSLEKVPSKSLPSSSLLCEEDTVTGWQGDKPERELSPEPEHAGTLMILWLPELWEQKSLLLKPLRLSYFVMSAGADWDSTFVGQWVLLCDSTQVYREAH